MFPGLHCVMCICLSVYVYIYPMGMFVFDRTSWLCVSRRIRKYLQCTRPIIEQYEKQGRVRTIDASRSVSEVRLRWAELKGVIIIMIRVSSQVFLICHLLCRSSPTWSQCSTERAGPADSALNEVPSRWNSCSQGSGTVVPQSTWIQPNITWF